MSGTYVTPAKQQLLSQSQGKTCESPNYLDVVIRSEDPTQVLAKQVVGVGLGDHGEGVVGELEGGQAAVLDGGHVMLPSALVGVGVAGGRAVVGAHDETVT